MAVSRLGSELRRWADLTAIQRAQASRLPERIFGEMGLKDVAELCRRYFGARPDRDYNEVRDQLLLIGIEWDLASDRLDQQSNTCLRAIADFLRC